MVKTLMSGMVRRRGAALVYVIIALVVVMILSGIVVNIVFTNLNMAKAQERNLQAYYLSVSGIDLCMAALVQETAAGEESSLLFINFDPTTYTSEKTLTDTLNLDGGNVSLTVRMAPDGTYGAAGERWIEITSTAVLSGSTITRTTKLAFLYTNRLVQKKVG